MFDDLNGQSTGSALAEMTENQKKKPDGCDGRTDEASAGVEPEKPSRSRDFFEEHHYASLLLKGPVPTGRVQAVSQPTFKEIVGPPAGAPKPAQEIPMQAAHPAIANTPPTAKSLEQPDFYEVSEEMWDRTETRQDAMDALEALEESAQQASIAAQELTTLLEIANESSHMVPAYEETDFGAALEALSERTGQSSLTYKGLSKLARDLSVKGGEAVVVAALLKHWFDLCSVYGRNWWQAEIDFDELQEWVEVQPQPDSVIDQNSRMRWDFLGSLLMGEQRLLSKSEALFKDVSSPITSVTPEAVYAGENGSQSLLAVLASMAAFNPGLVLKLVSSNRDGSYTVSFPGFKAGGIEVPELTETEIAGGCAPITQHGSWVAVLEKALGRYLKHCALSILPSCEVLESIPDRIFDCRLLLILGVTLPGLNATCGDYVIPAWTDAFWSKPDRIARLWDRYLRGAKSQGRPAIAMNQRQVLGVVDYEPDKYDLQKSKVTLYDHHKGQRVTMTLGYCIEHYSAVAFGSSAAERSTWQYYLSKALEFKLVPYILSGAV